MSLESILLAFSARAVYLLNMDKQTNSCTGKFYYEVLEVRPAMSGEFWALTFAGSLCCGVPNDGGPAPLPGDVLESSEELWAGTLLRHARLAILRRKR